MHAVASHIDCEHSDILLDGTALADPAVRAAAVGARDMTVGIGDRDNSLYLLFAAIREQSTVALSGESADEVFGGYPWFHDDEQRWADTFPWLANQRGFIHSAGLRPTRRATGPATGSTTPSPNTPPRRDGPNRRGRPDPVPRSTHSCSNHWPRRRG